MAPNLLQWDKGITRPDLWGPLGAISGHFGVHLEVILGPRAKDCGLFVTYFSPIWLLKMTLMAQNSVQWDKVLPHLTGGGLWGQFW